MSERSETPAGDAPEPVAAGPGEAAARGARQVRAVMVSLLGSFVLSALLGGTPIVAAIAWGGLFGFLWVSMRAGRRWARWVAAALAGVLAAASLYTAALQLQSAGDAWALLGGLGLLYALSAFVLAVSPKVTAYLAAPRG